MSFTSLKLFQVRRKLTVGYGNHFLIKPFLFAGCFTGAVRIIESFVQIIEPVGRLYFPQETPL